MKVEIIKKYHPDGKIQFEYYLKNSQWHGIAKNWHSDNTMIEMTKYKNNQENGLYIYFNY